MDKRQKQEKVLKYAELMVESAVSKFGPGGCKDLLKRLVQERVELEDAAVAQNRYLIVEPK